MSDIETFPDIESTVPTYRSFFTPHEHRDRLETVAASNAGADLSSIGDSEAGRPIHALTLGEGSTTAMFIGGAHANEPVGSMTCQALLQVLTTDDVLRRSLDYEFVFVPVADVDGAILNRGWFDGPFTVENYALNFYRPDPSRDVEWRFPFEYRQLSFTDPPPENQALADCLREHAPGFVGSFHNAPLGTCFHCLSDPFESLYDPLQAIPNEHDVPLYRGEPDASYMDELADGIFTVPTTVDQYEWATDVPDVDPGELDTGGGTLDFAREHNPDAVQLFTEVPYWRADVAADETPVDRTRAAVLVDGLDARQEIAELFSGYLDDVGASLPETRLAASIRSFADLDPERFEQRKQRIRDADEYDDNATRAQVWSETQLQPFARLLYVGPLLRTVERAIQETTDPGARAALRSVHRDARQSFHDKLASFDLDGELVPISELVTIQARSVLTCLSALDDKDYFA